MHLVRHALVPVSVLALASPCAVPVERPPCAGRELAPFRIDLDQSRRSTAAKRRSAMQVSRWCHVPTRRMIGCGE